MAKKSFINKILQKYPQARRVLRTTGSAGHEPGARIAGAMGHGLHGVAGRLERTGHRMRRRCQPRADSQTMPAGKAYGIDLSQESVAFARRKNRRLLGTRCFVERGDVGKLPYGDGTFGAVTAFETVYFWDDLPEAFAEVARVLKTGGRFLLCSEMMRHRRTKCGRAASTG